MFFNKKKKQEQDNTIKYCNVDNNLKECESVSKLRKYQNELFSIETTKISHIINKYFRYYNQGIINYISQHMSDTTLFFENSLCYLRDTENDSFENRFKQFGKELDEYFERVKRINELKNLIGTEKQKLGI